MAARASVRSLFFTPPMAVARLGGSDTPVDAFVWREDPTTLGGASETVSPQVRGRVGHGPTVAVPH